MDYFRHKWTFKAMRFVSIILTSESQQSRLHSLLSYMHQAVSGGLVPKAEVGGDQSGIQHNQPQCTTKHP